jgi:trehalose/maltose hydrolase-like predicted phosphorylase
MSWLVDEAQLGGLSADARSTVFSVGNGEQCVRGTASAAFTVADPPYPFRGSYLAGLYTRGGWNLDYPLCGPDWTAEATTLNGRRPNVASRNMRLDMRRGVLTHQIELDAGGAAARCTEERFISWTDLGACCQRLTVQAVGGPVDVELTAGIDGDVRNNPAKDYKPGWPRNCDQRGVELSRVEDATAHDGLLRVILKARSTRHRVRSIGVLRQAAGPRARTADGVANGLAFTRFSVALREGDRLVVEKVVLTDWYSAGVDAFPDELSRAVQARACTFHRELAAHQAQVEAFWRLADVRIQGDDFSQLAVRFALWSTRIAAPLRTDASIGPKNLTGDWYRGGVMWDMDMYQLPVLSAIDPARGRNHLRYRHRRLDLMKMLARMEGWDGARIPGVSYESGDERGFRVGGLAGQQLHIDLAASWGVLHAYFLHGDAGELIRGGGLEMLLELGKFWLSFIPDAEADGLYHIRNVCGPDELHPGVDDNTYTNIFSAWTLAATAEVVRRAAEEHPEAVADLRRRCGWTDADSARARDIASRMFVPKLPDGAPAQFANFEAQPEANFAIRNKWWAGDNTHKQADIVMLSQVLPRETGPAWLAAAYDANVPLCTQTSSLSPGTHVIAAVQLRRLRDAQRFWRLAAGMDLADSFGNAAHGIHGAGQGGVWLGAVHGFGGMRAGIDGLEIDPLLPPFWQRLEYAVVYRGQVLSVDVEPGWFTVTNTGTAEVAVTLGGKQTAIAPASSVRTPVTAKWQRPRLRAVLLAVDALLGDAATLHRLAAELKAAGIRTAAVSARRDLPDALEQAGLAGAFSATMDGTMLTELPPKPQAFLLAANRCRSLPWECLAVAASQTDVEAAKRGGATTIAVNGFTGGQADVAKSADLTVDGLKRIFEQHENPIDPFLELNIAKMRTELGG